MTITTPEAIERTLRLCEERAAEYGALRQSCLTSIALDRASETIRTLSAENARLREALDIRTAASTALQENK